MECKNKEKPVTPINNPIQGITYNTNQKENTNVS